MAQDSYFRYRRWDDGAVEALRREFEQARPFPHLVLEDFLEAPPEGILEAFPGRDWPAWHRFQDPYQAEKMTCRDVERIPAPLDAMIRELNSPAFLQFLERVTGIGKLLPDPYLEGAGLHCSGPGGVLAPHTDFHDYLRLDLFRRINVLVYLNPGWRREDGGCLELYEKGRDEPERIVNPAWGSCVIFRTDDQSVHGFTRPIAEGRWRKSIALYYYTSRETSGFSGDETTHWQQHGKQQGASRLRLRAYQTFLSASRVFSRMAHALNPNLRAPLRPKAAAALGALAGLPVGLLAGVVALLAGAGAGGAAQALALLAAAACVMAGCGAAAGWLLARRGAR